MLDPDPACRRLIQAAARVGYDGDAKPDQLHKLFANRSTAVALDALSEWMESVCPGAAEIAR